MEKTRQLAFTDVNDIAIQLDDDSLLQLLDEMEEPSGMITGEDSIEYYVDSEGRRAWRFKWNNISTTLEICANMKE
ncbi:hypothetical protein HY469_05370 [Candidatus Roizmanbacteria bacterium]|nr:hypothetical protein [Candidatus Roizmanbacteria bacterium]